MRYSFCTPTLYLRGVLLYFTVTKAAAAVVVAAAARAHLKCQQ